MDADLIKFAPPMSVLTPGLKWHVYISCRQSENRWAVQLYDVLRQLNYQVFWDQDVAIVGGDFLSGLQGLRFSACGVLIWSGVSADSKWVQTEYSVMQSRAEAGRFQYVVANLHNSRPPLFAPKATWVDFSEAPEGPWGSALLRLLWGLQGLSMPRDVEAIAREVDAQIRKDLRRIQAAKELADGDTIVSMARSTHPAWTWTELLGCAAAQALLGLSQYDDAVRLLEELRHRYPRSRRPMQLLALAFRRIGQIESSKDVLAQLYQLGARDSETLGIYAGTSMDAYRRTGSSHDLRKARELYSEAFERSPDDYYVGINAASTSLLSGSITDAQRLAERVKENVGAAPSPDFWLLATQAEAKLILGQYEEAAAVYRMAVLASPDALGSHSSTLAQAMRLMDSLGTNAEQRATIVSALRQGALST
jgi:tetratricopeptide (TPR) repeat protein